MSVTRTRKLVGVVALAFLLSACKANWWTWGGNPERQSYNPNETTLTSDNVTGLAHQWSVDLGSYVNSSPVVAANLDIDGTKHDVVYVGTEHGLLYAVSDAGAVVWSRQLGANTQLYCKSTPDGVHGVSASAVYDGATHRVYAADGDGQMWALDAITGSTIDGWPVRFATDGVHDIVESAPTLVGNHLYVETAGYCDTPPYHGRIADIDPTTATVAHTWFTAGETGPNGGGIWGWGGVSVDRADGDVYAATGNVGADPENTPYGDAVVRLSADLQLKAAHSPTPLIGDDDFGSTPMLFQKSGCPAQLVVLQKNGSLYLYDRDTIAAGYRQRVTFGQPNLIGVAAYSPATQYVYVMNNWGSADATYVRGIAAFRVNDTCNLELAWQTAATVGVAVTPVVANGVVYFAGGYPGKLYAVDATTGAPLWNSGTSISGAVNATPTVANGRLYDGGYDGKLHAWGLPPS